MRVKRYNFEGITLDIPLYYDEQTKMYIEYYPDFIQNPTWTSEGHRVLFSGTDACPLSEENGSGDCPDCGSCKHFKLVAEHTWVGICMNGRSYVNDSSR